MYTTFGGNASGNRQLMTNPALRRQDTASNGEFYIGFEDEAYTAECDHWQSVPAVSSTQRNFAGTQQSQATHQPPPPPPKSILYGLAESEMSFTNSQNLQYNMLCQMQMIPKSETKPTGEVADKLAKEGASDDQKRELPKKPVLEREKTLERAKTVGNLLKKDAALKDKVRQSFIDELMKQQAISGTFEVTEGTVKPFTTYSDGDPVATYSAKEKNIDLAGKSWDCEFDCEYLRKAMKGLGTDEDAIIHVVTTRCNSQRQQMKKVYQTMFGRNLISDLRSELSGDLREAVMACFVTPAEFDSWSIKEAIFGLGTDEQALIEILMTRTNAQIKQLKEVYSSVSSPCMPEQAAQTRLEKDISEDTSGDFMRLLIAAAQGQRAVVTRDQLEKAVEEIVVNGSPNGTFKVNYEKLVDKEKCKRNARALYAAGEERWGTDEDTFIKIFSIRSYYELRAIWSEYVKISQRDILNSIDRETSGDFRSGLAAVVKNIRCRPMYFAERLKTSMKGLGTADKDLIRIIISRSEIDMVQIMQCFQELTNQSLWTWLKDDCSGDYRKLLQGIVGQG